MLKSYCYSKRMGRYIRYYYFIKGEGEGDRFKVYVYCGNLTGNLTSYRR